jgi:hypothetical protein
LCVRLWWAGQFVQYDHASVVLLEVGGVCPARSRVRTPGALLSHHTSGLSATNKAVAECRTGPKQHQSDFPGTGPKQKAGV